MLNALYFVLLSMPKEAVLFFPWRPCWVASSVWVSSPPAPSWW